ncbi:diacylglycerol/lipid kinase family protein [Croceicoccus hydrothermalis]|uniref:diacylglycerol/lipid kinase family protein n=1 Tax=Croceicoccus hydrothermalis TaxID=2867964 RepID=UPI001EFA3867|nr:diacylglycerol kinase family protein [Croceicoccus hydrothermalis]
MSSHMPLWLLVNGTSGSHQQDRIEMLRERLSLSGRGPDRILDCQTDGMPDRATLEEAGVGTLAVHGGDGTINGAVINVEGWDGQLFPLPGGTANLLCHRLYSNVDLERIVAQFTAGNLSRRRIGCVCCDAGLALSEMLLGPGAKWADVREDMRGHAIGKFVEDTLDAAGQSVNGPMVRLVRPALGKAAGYSGVRLVPRSDDFAVEGYGPETLADFLAQGAAVIARNFREGPHETLACVDRLDCETEGGEPIAMMMDGERCEADSPVTLWHRQLELDILGERA